jgi:hypothetical protein
VVKSCWGQVEVKTQRLKHKDGKQTQVYHDGSLDNSGWSPEALERLLELVIELPYETASSFARRFGLVSSSSSLERLSQPYLVRCQQQLRTRLIEPEVTSAVTSTHTSKRLMVLQTDGVMVLKRPNDGHCEGMEIKSAVSSKRTASKIESCSLRAVLPRSFFPCLEGLTRRYCSQDDFIVGVGDGAPWVENALDLLANIRITDVFHSCQYLDILMQELGWDDSKRTQHRHIWCRGDISAQGWLSLHLPLPEQRKDWAQEANSALDYLTDRLEHMNYPAFKTKGFPIGSGQVEAMNKNVIGNRLKRSGMHWSKSGASSMAATRALAFSKFKLCSFDQLRFSGLSFTCLRGDTPRLRQNQKQLRQKARTRVEPQKLLLSLRL